MASGGIYQWTKNEFKDDREVPDTLSALYEYPDRFHLNYSCFFGNDQYGYGEQFMGQKGTIEVMDRQNLHFYPQPKFIRGAKPFSKQTGEIASELTEGLQPAGRDRRSRAQFPRCRARKDKAHRAGARRPDRGHSRPHGDPVVTSRASEFSGTRRPRSTASSKQSAVYGYLRRNRSTAAGWARSAPLPPSCRCAAPSPALKAPKLLVREDGSMVGTIGGGCVEAEVWNAAREVIETEKPRHLHFNLGQDAAYDNGLICGGQLDVFVEPVMPQPARIHLRRRAHLEEPLESRGPGRLPHRRHR